MTMLVWDFLYYFEKGTILGRKLKTKEEAKLVILAHVLIWYSIERTQYNPGMSLLELEKRY